MRIPFPHSLNIGTDIIRLSRLLKSPHTFHKLVLRILQPVEQQVFFERFGTLPLGNAPERSITERKGHEWLGGRWAAKEAAKKAWGASLLSFKDLRIETAPDGDVVVVCALLEGGQPGQEFDEQVAKLSISHDGEYATATVLASPLHESITAELRRRKSEAEKSVTPKLTGNDKASIDA
jgi:holo-[acyl-carrier protein] synthase